MGLQAKLKAIAEACVEKVIVPDRISCCGWAGDKGFTHPGLNASALRDLKAALPEDCTSGYSTSRTCEIGLSCTVDVSTAPSSIWWIAARNPIRADSLADSIDSRDTRRGAQGNQLPGMGG